MANHIRVFSIVQEFKLIKPFQIKSTFFQPVITNSIYALHKITIGLKFMSYINSDLPVPVKKPQASHNIQDGSMAWNRVDSWQCDERNQFNSSQIKST